MKIIVAYDGSEQSKKALNKAIELAAKSGNELTLLTVTEPVCPVSIHEKDCAVLDERFRKETDEILEKVKKDIEKEPISITTEVRTGRPDEEIVKFSKEKEADLIVIGSHGRHGAMKFLLGSVSMRVADNAVCSVLIVK